MSRSATSENSAFTSAGSVERSAFDKSLQVVSCAARSTQALNHGCGSSTLGDREGELSRDEELEGGTALVKKIGRLA